MIRKQHTHTLTQSTRLTDDCLVGKAINGRGLPSIQLTGVDKTCTFWVGLRWSCYGSKTQATCVLVAFRFRWWWFTSLYRISHTRALSTQTCRDGGDIRGNGIRAARWWWWLRFVGVCRIYSVGLRGPCKTRAFLLFNRRVFLVDAILPRAFRVNICKTKICVFFGKQKFKKIKNT